MTEAPHNVAIISSHPMTEIQSIPRPSPRKKPVRLRLQRIHAELSRPYPPREGAKEWWDRLKAAMGTASSDFVNATLFQLQSAARLPNGGVSETAVNAALSMIETAKPDGEIEAALIVQMACTHAAAMAVLSRVGGARMRPIAHQLPSRLNQIPRLAVCGVSTVVAGCASGVIGRHRRERCEPVTGISVTLRTLAF
jgi:hypothetical protein